MTFSFSDLLKALCLGSVGRTKRKGWNLNFCNVDWYQIHIGKLFFFLPQKICWVGSLEKLKINYARPKEVSATYKLKDQVTMILRKIGKDKVKMSIEALWSSFVQKLLIEINWLLIFSIFEQSVQNKNVKEFDCIIEDNWTLPTVRIQVWKIRLITLRLLVSVRQLLKMQI